METYYSILGMTVPANYCLLILTVVAAVISVIAFKGLIRVGLLLLFIALGAGEFIATHQANKTHDKEVKETQQKLNDSLDAQHTMNGELFTLKAVIEKMEQSGELNGKQVAVLAGTVKEIQRTNLQNSTASADLKDLCSEESHLTERLRKVESHAISARQLASGDSRAISLANSNERSAFAENTDELTAVYNGLRKRLKGPPPSFPDSVLHTLGQFLDPNDVTTPHPLADTAEYLDALARTVCQ